MPYIIWIAVAIAILLLGDGVSDRIENSPVAGMLNGPGELIVTCAVLVLIGIALLKRPQR